MAPKYIDPDLEGIHPLRLELSEDDWIRLDDVIANGGEGEATLEEVEAYADWLHDELVAKLQTHCGITLIQ
jgi:hypothetical protein